MTRRILITGSSGLIGTRLETVLGLRGSQLVRLDIRAAGEHQGDVRDPERVRNAVSDVDGIVHLAAVSRVVWGERNPELCHATNVDGLRNVLVAAEQSIRKPWLIFASSREVYGQPDALPVVEDDALKPVNVYGRSKAQGEWLVAEAQARGVRACTIRLSNVYGSTDDHADRVVPAFARAAALGRTLRVDGLEHTFDFTHVDDVARGIGALVGLLESTDHPVPPIHFVSGRPTTLGELAGLACRLGRSGSTILPAAPRDFDVARFFGNPARAMALLGWQPVISLEDGLSRLVQAFRKLHIDGVGTEIAQ